MKSSLKKVLCFALCFCVLSASVPLFPVTASAAGTPVIEFFNSPDRTSKPMARMWFPDASAGVDDNDVIEKQINELAVKGMGGVEICFLTGSSNYTNAQAKDFGWGTPNWTKVLKKIFQAANKVPGGFQVDVTITAHWPPGVGYLDPNDNEASRELVYTVTKIKASDLASGALPLVLPVTKVDTNTRFILNDTFEAAAVAQYTGTEGSGSSAVQKFDFNSLIPVTDKVSIIAGADEPAGVPDEAYCAAQGWNYATVLEQLGPEPVEPLPAGVKFDSEGNRKRLADVQHHYRADLSGVVLSGLDNTDTLQTGDYVIITAYYRGTAQRGHTGKYVYNSAFVTNYFTEVGTKILTDTWDKYILDPELIALMRANGGSIFEDSIEASKTTSFWAHDLMDNFDDSYAYKDIMPIIVSSMGASGGASQGTARKFFNFENDGDLQNRIYQEYTLMLGELYKSLRITGISNWAKNTLGYNFRTQCYYLPGLDIPSAALIADIVEGDNMSKGDGLRTLVSAVNMDAKAYMSMEAVTGRSCNQISLADAKTEVAQNYSDGVNRIIFHGTPYAKSLNGYAADWPGWLPFGTSFGDAYTYRQAYWDDFGNELNYMARTQAVLQHGTAKIDVAFLIDKAASFTLPSRNKFQEILDAGYSYNRMTESLLFSNNAIVKNNRLADDGPSYKALVLDEVKSISLEGIQKVIRLAEDGLPIIIYNSDVTAIYGSNMADDAKVAEAFAELKAMPGIKTATTTTEVLSVLKEMGVYSYASYNMSQLETTMYSDAADGTNYYYIFNNSRPTNSGMLAGGQGASYKGEDRAVNHVEITLTGNGVPYVLDALTGEITQIGAYTANGDGTVSFVLDKLFGGDSTIVAVTTNTDAFPQTGAYVTSVNKPFADYAVVRDIGGLSLRSNVPGDYDVTFSNGISAKASVSKSLNVLDLSNKPWNLIIDSYSPKYSRARDMIDPVTGIQTIDPGEHIITRVDLGAQGLGNWSAIPATSEQLAALGVTNMRNVSGTGYYTLTFDAPSDWDADTGAYMDVTYAWDQIGAYIVNGVTIPFANNASDRVDLGGYLKPGENTITIKLNTTLYGRAFLEHHLYNYGSGTFAATYFNGLQSVKLTPYTQVGISENVLASIGSDEATMAVNAPASYTVSLSNAKGVGVVTLSFTTDGRYLDLTSATALNGFSIVDPLSWEYIGGQVWKGTVKLYCPSFVQNSDPLDVLRISGVARDFIGETTVTLVDFTVTGDINGYSATMPSEIMTAVATASIVPVYSKYDLNHDGRIDELDLAIVVYYYLANDLEADWEVVKFDIASAKDCDVAVNGRVDLADMIEVIANYCDSYDL